jgi:hypothetical protein
MMVAFILPLPLTFIGVDSVQEKLADVEPDITVVVILVLNNWHGSPSGSVKPHGVGGDDWHS